nr:MAG TPA: hypothetical protein [Caudoviricetes sp.]
MIDNSNSFSHKRCFDNLYSSLIWVSHSWRKKKNRTKE